MSSSYMLRVQFQGAHVKVIVFAGPDSEHRACAGHLTFREGPEADRFIDRLGNGFAEIQDDRHPTVETHGHPRAAKCSECDEVVIMCDNNIWLDRQVGPADTFEYTWRIMPVGSIFMAAAGGDASTPAHRLHKHQPPEGE